MNFLFFFWITLFSEALQEHEFRLGLTKIVKESESIRWMRVIRASLFC